MTVEWMIEGEIQVEGVIKMEWVTQVEEVIEVAWVIAEHHVVQVFDSFPEVHRFRFQLFGPKQNHKPVKSTCKSIKLVIDRPLSRHHLLLSVGTRPLHHAVHFGPMILLRAFWRPIGHVSEVLRETESHRSLCSFFLLCSSRSISSSASSICLFKALRRRFNFDKINTVGLFVGLQLQILDHFLQSGLLEHGLVSFIPTLPQLLLPKLLQIAQLPTVVRFINIDLLLELQRGRLGRHHDIVHL
ncbi:hypothetical protein EYF80_002213 [Liparis tanakae]|uniref:Uncharacterized protein n=1 Tax=Liparis tanakae TaxID=230148 RepID=A0A4Z2JBC0_9TELE|nr:hypothetical protein EYF80_002213 [Liparis tanakae]